MVPAGMRWGGCLQCWWEEGEVMQLRALCVCPVSSHTTSCIQDLVTSGFRGWETRFAQSLWMSVSGVPDQESHF